MSFNINSFKEKASQIEEWLVKEFAGFRTGRASPAILEKVVVEAYGSRQPISHLATVSILDPKNLHIIPWDKELVRPIETAIAAANLGVSVMSDGSLVRVSFPELTSERRIQLVKLLKEKLEEARVKVRNEREKAWNEIQRKEKEGEISEDEKFRLKEALQKLVDVTNNRLEESTLRKEKDILE